jgi:inner membrane protein
VRPFWPFSERWYSWDIVFIVEPVLLVALTLGLTLPALVALIKHRNGTQIPGTQFAPAGRVAAIFALLAVAALWGVRDFEHRRAVDALEARTYQGSAPLRVSAYPYMTNPFHWYGVVETDPLFATLDLDTRAAESDTHAQIELHYKPQETAVTLAAKKTYLGRVYLSWAQYPVVESFQLQNEDANRSAEDAGVAYAVHFLDLRYDYAVRKARVSLGGVVLLSRDLKAVGERFGPGGSSVANSSSKDPAR